MEESFPFLASKAQCLHESAIQKIILRERRKSFKRDNLISLMSPSKVLRYLKLNVKITKTLFQTIFTAQHMPLDVSENSRVVIDVPRMKIPYMKYNAKDAVDRIGFEKQFYDLFFKVNKMEQLSSHYLWTQIPNTNNIGNIVALKEMMYRFKLQNKYFMKKYNVSDRPRIYRMLWHLLYRVIYIKFLRMENTEEAEILSNARHIRRVRVDFIEEVVNENPHYDACFIREYTVSRTSPQDILLDIKSDFE